MGFSSQRFRSCLKQQPHKSSSLATGDNLTDSSAAYTTLQQTLTKNNSHQQATNKDHDHILTTECNDMQFQTTANYRALSRVTSSCILSRPGTQTPKIYTGETTPPLHISTTILTCTVHQPFVRASNQSHIFQILDVPCPKKTG